MSSSLYSLRHYAPPALPPAGLPVVPPAEPAEAVERWQALFGDVRLGAEVLLTLQSMATPHELPAGARVFGRSDAARGLVAVLEGSVGLGQQREDGVFQLERTLRGPAWVDLASAWLTEGHGQDAQTLGPARVVELPLAGMRQLMLRQPLLQERVMVALAQTVRALSAVTHDLMHKDAEKRLVAWLLQQSEGQSQLRLAERKRDIAAQLAITPETLSRMMRQLKEKGLIAVAGYTVQLLDLGGLQALVRED